LAQYDNVLGFFAGNEVTSNSSNTYASAFVKAAIRDTKAYIQQQGYRNIPVGYSANDDSTTREPEAEYFACAPAAASADFYGINMYEWCGDATYESSGYEARTAEFSNYSIPIFFSEYGCNVPEPRLFNEVQALYGSEMTPVWSGGIVYEYFQEVNDYGLVSQIGSSVSPLPDYTALSSQLNKINPSRTMNSTYTPTNTPPPCPSPENAYWVAATALPPTPNEGLCSCAPPTWGCAARSTLPAENITELFGYICGSLGVNCAGINANGTFPGQYGAYSPCSDIVKLSFLMNMYYDSQKQVAGACDFGGQATTQKAQSATGTCSVLIAEAGSSGTGSVTATAGLVTGTGSNSPTGSGSGSGSSSSSTSKSAGHSVVGGLYGEMRVVVAIACAFFGGAAIVLL
jgi:1,3-beta-glucanosyltransferase GAS1